MRDTKIAPISGRSPSGRFVLRIDPELHAALRESAKHSDLSLNDFCARKLAAPASEVEGSAAEVVQRCSSLFGQALVGVVAFGSWAREEQREGSDVDVLVVLEPSTKITRALYRRWDSDPLGWEGRPVEPHLVHLPKTEARITGLWAEVAVDGVVLFDRDLSVSRRLVEIRREIAAGRIVRREAHGQPYWIGAV